MFITNLISANLVPARIILYSSVVVGVFYSGYHVRSLSAEKQISDIKLEVVTANQKALEMQRELEQQKRLEVASIQEKYQRQLEDIQNEKSKVDDIIASIPAGGLWGDVEYNTCKLAATPATSGANGIRHCRLSAATAKRLSTIAYKADQNAAKLNECIAVLHNDRTK